MSSDDIPDYVPEWNSVSVVGDSNRELAEKRETTGYVLSLVAYLDDGVRMLIGTKMPNLTSDLNDSIFEGTGPLSTFSGRILVATALGLLEASDATELKKLKNIRNKFAHRSLVPLDFDDPDVVKLASKLDRTKNQVGKDASPREAFTQTYLYLNEMIYRAGIISMARASAERDFQG